MRQRRRLNAVLVTGTLYSRRVLQAKLESERWLERYAREQGLGGWDDHHPDLGAKGPCPDYRLSRDQAAAICEVKEFRTRWLDRLFDGRRGAVTTSAKPVYRAVRNAVGDAAKQQLRPYIDRGEPLVIVLANPHGAQVHLDEPNEVLAALYGNPVVQGSVDPATGQAGPMRGMYGRDGVLSESHLYIGAVVTLHSRTNADDYWDRWSDENRHKWEGIEDSAKAAKVVLEERTREEGRARIPEGDYLYVHVFETKSSVEGEAAPLSRELFNSERDDRWAYNPETGGWDELC